MARQVAPRRFAKTVDFKEWNTTLTGLVNQVDLAELVKGLGDTASEATVPLTVLRMRGSVTLQLDTAAVDERAIIAVGIGIANRDAITIGATALPGPFSEGGFPWIWHSMIGLSSGAQASVINQFLLQFTVIDSKAMRKMKTTETLFIMAEVASSLDQGGTFDMQYGVRILLGT